MRTEIGVQPWAYHFEAYLYGEKLEMCIVADEEQGCAEVYADWETTSTGAHRLLSHRTRMVFGEIEDRPMTDVGRRIKADPENAEAIWAAWVADNKERYG